MKITDEHLLLLDRYARTGDAEAFTELVRRYRSMVYSTCLRVLGNPSDAEDVTRECFLSLARGSDRQWGIPHAAHLVIVDGHACQLQFHRDILNAEEHVAPPRPELIPFAGRCHWSPFIFWHAPGRRWASRW